MGFSIGNDIVDLGDPMAKTAHLRPRFVARVCSQAERTRLAQVDERKSNEFLWSLFAAKEAAYKAIARLAPETIFAHRRFEVSEDLGAVTFGGRRLLVEVTRIEGGLHAVATDGPTLSGIRVGTQRLFAVSDARGAGREALRTAVARNMGCPLSEVEIHRPPRVGSWDGYGPPVLRLRGTDRLDPISLSHDGQLTAFAWVPSAAETLPAHCS